jgi:TP901 family phage tail tape measure protein
MAGFSILAKLGLDSSKFASSLKSQNTAMGKFGAAIGTAVKAGAVIAGAAFAAFTMKGIKDMIEFEQSISEVFTLLPGITEESMASMSDSVRKLSTTMGVDLGDATSALYQAISAGVPQDNVFEFMEIAAKASVGGVTSLETAVDGITTAINTYGSANLSAKDAADSMFTAVKLGKTNFDELSGALFNVLPIAKQAGVAFDEVTAALAVMTSKGTPTTVATTQLRAAMTALIAPTEATKLAFKGFDLDIENLKDIMAGGDGGLVKAMQQVMVATNGDETAIRKLLGSTEAMNAVFTLTAGGAKSFGVAMEEMGNKTGATDAAFAVMEKTVGHQIDKMMASFKNLGLSVGNAFLPMINKVLPDIIAGFNNAVGPVEKFAKTFPALLVSIGDLIATFVRFGVILVSFVATSKAAAVVTTGLAMAKNALTIATKGASIAMQLFNKVSKANIIGLVVAAAVAAAMAFKQWAKHQEALNTVMRPSAEFLKEMEKNAKDAAKEYENAKDRVKHLTEQLAELNRQDGLKAEGITELQDALAVRKESLAVLREELAIQLKAAEADEGGLWLVERKLKIKLREKLLTHERLAVERKNIATATGYQAYRKRYFRNRKETNARNRRRKNRTD